MIPMRIRMFVIAALCNLFSYTRQALEIAYDCIVEEILDILTIIAEGMYSFSYSHLEAFRDRIQDKRSRTTYIRDGYGRRYRKVSPATKEFNAINYRPFLRRYLR